MEYARAASISWTSSEANMKCSFTKLIIQPNLGVLARASLYAQSVYFCYICKGQITREYGKTA